MTKASSTPALSNESVDLNAPSSRDASLADISFVLCAPLSRFDVRLVYKGHMPREEI